MIQRKEIQESEYNPYYAPYLQQVPETMTLMEALEMGESLTTDFFGNLTEEQYNLRYAPEKWTPKEILLHLIDTERIFSYRALRFGRMDKNALAGFDQDDYVAHAQASGRMMESLLTEYSSVRQATLTLFKSMNDLSLATLGEASGSLMSPRAAGFMTAGHERHHIQIIKERYL